MLIDNFYRAFEDRFRESREIIKSRLEVYLPFVKKIKNFDSKPNAIDLGCGRGEWLELLAENSYLGHGVDLDTGMLEACESRGLNVSQKDAIFALKELDNESINIVSGFHIVEHLPFDILQSLVQEALRVLKPGGLLILETPNSENIKVATVNFYLDPTHVHPIPSQLLSFLTEHYGFGRTKVLRLQESKTLHTDNSISLLKVITGASPDYAVIAQKQATNEIMSSFDELFVKEYGLSLETLAERFENHLLKIEAQASEANAKAQQAQTQAQQAQTQAQQAQTQAQQAQTQAQQAQTQAQQAQTQANEVWDHYAMVVNSRSWKLTYPLRIIGKTMRWFVRGSIAWLIFSPTSRPRRVAKKILFKLKNYINNHPKLKLKLMSILNQFPTLKTKLKNIRPLDYPLEQHERDELTFQAQRIYDELKLLFHELPKQTRSVVIKVDANRKPKMAMVTPFPPDRTGIADYIAELLPSLSECYDIEIITDKHNTDFYDSFPIRDIEYFKNHSNDYNYVVYQMGNSPFHAHMFRLIHEIPGIVVLHDFYLGNIMHWLQGNAYESSAMWDTSLIDEYGYSSLYQRNQNGIHWTTYQFPANAQVLRDAKGIIVHSQYAKSLASQWYGNKFKNKIYFLPQVHSIVEEANLDLNNHKSSEEFLVCSFGYITETKLIHKIISAWSLSILSANQNNRLLLVGSLEDNDYGEKIKRLVKTLSNVEITGFVEDIEYQRLLSRANMAIQLRSESRGETSRAVLDCMAYGIPTIINANGSMGELPDECVFKLQDRFPDDELLKALDDLYVNYELRKTISTNAKAMIAQNHGPNIVVQKMENIVEEIYAKPTAQTLGEFCISYLVQNPLPNEEQIAQLSKELELDRHKDQTPNLYIDISAVALHDLKTGIQRVVRSILIALLEMPFMQYKIIPVYLTDKGGYWHYRVAHTFMRFFIPDLIHRSDTVIEPSLSDIFLGLDYYADAVTQAVKSNLFTEWKERGVAINFVVYDILPIEFPHFFPASSCDEHLKWLISISQVSDNLLCISNTVAEAVNEFLKESVINQDNFPHTTFFHLGADIDNSIPSKGMPENAEYVLSQLSSAPSFVSVGTVEPRKGQKQTLVAFEKLWADSIDINLVIIGKQGWMVDEVAAKMRSHPERNKRLFWLEGISDEYLEKVYAASTCLIAASEGEGFGLPLIEAAQHKLSIIARDIPVFREVAGKYAYYFTNDNDPSVLADTISSWLELYKDDTHPKSDDIPWLTWKESAEHLLAILKLKKVRSHK